MGVSRLLGNNTPNNVKHGSNVSIVLAQSVVLLSNKHRLYMYMQPGPFCTRPNCRCKSPTQH